MKKDELNFNIEKMLEQDAENIEIDFDFKASLKAHIMNKEISEIKNTNHMDRAQYFRNFKLDKKYLKIASSFIIFAVIGGGLFSALYNHGNGNVEINSKEDVSKKLNVDNLHKNSSLKNSSNKISNLPENTKDSNAVSLDNSKKGEINENKNIAKNKELKDIFAKTKGGSLSSTKDFKGNIANNKEKTIIKPDGKYKLSLSDLIESDKNNKNLTGPNKLNIMIPQIEDIKQEINIEKLNCYDASAYKDGSKFLIASTDGIYVKEKSTGKKTKIISSESKNIILQKPNFLSNENIVYCKSDVANGEDTICIYNIDSKSNRELIKGKNPMVAADREQLAYEYENKIYVINVLNKNSKLIDEGRYPSWSADGKHLSYIKENKEKEIFDKSTEMKNLYLEKKTSSIWFCNLSDNTKYPITEKEYVIDNDDVRKWADEVIQGRMISNFNILGKYSYFESIWSNDNKELYVIRKDNETNIYEFVKFNLN